MTEDKAGISRFEDLPIDKIVANDFNANEMDEDTFNMLAESIQTNGFVEPIQVVESETVPGTYTIIGGEHRWKVCKTLGWEKIPAVVLKNVDIDNQKFLTVKLNLLRGKLNPIKFAKLLEEFKGKYGKEELRNYFGFTDRDAFERLFNNVLRNVPPEIKKKLLEEKDKIQSIDQLSAILNKLFSEYGDTLQQNFMVFTWGGKESVMIKCDTEARYALMRKVADAAKLHKVNIWNYLDEVFNKKTVENVIANIEDEVKENA